MGLNCLDGTAYRLAVRISGNGNAVSGTLALILVVPWLVRDRRPGPIARTGVVLGAAVTGGLVVAVGVDEQVEVELAGHEAAASALASLAAG